MSAPQPAPPGGSPALVEVVRSGFVESVHRGRVVALAADGSVAWSAGDVTSPVFPRSVSKVLQAVAMLRCGLHLDGELLALVGASHSGEPFHLDGVRRLLADAGLDESALQTPPDYPLDERARADLLRAGQPPSRLAMNCSGKHAGMLATCVGAGWPTDSYLRPDHPLQQAVRATVAELTEEPVVAAGVDGCGAPLFGVSLTGLARGFRTVGLGRPGSPEGRVAQAFRRHPTWASGTRRDEAALLAAIPGLVGKAGAEAAYAVSLPDGRAVALKIDDGGARARPVAMAAALRRLGLDHPVLTEQAAAPVFGGGYPVGALRAVLP